MLKAERKEATTIKIMASAKCLPGQIRFPNPNIVHTTGSSPKLPSGLINRSGLKESGSGYAVGSWRIALKKVGAEREKIEQIPHHRFTITTAPKSTD